MTEESSSTEKLERSNNMNTTLNDAEAIESKQNDISKKRNKNKSYIFVKTFESKEIAFKTILQDKEIQDTNWSKSDLRITKSGSKQFFKCKICTNMAYALAHQDSPEISIYVEDKSHNHDEEKDQFYFTPATSEILTKLKDEGKKPSQVLKHLKDNQDSKIQNTKII